MKARHSAVYEGRLTHTRRGPRAHRFAYRQRLFYLDLDELDALVRASPAWRKGRFGPISFHRPDYLGPAATPLAAAVRSLVEARLGVRPEGPIRLLTHLRTFGYVFNPVSFYFCFAADGATLEALVAEITNTPWGERHAYVMRADAGGVRSEFDKVFHVSPFFAMTQRYQWTFTVPGDTLAVSMVNVEEGCRVFSATLSLRRRPLTTGALLSLIVRQPLAPLLVHAAIFLHAGLLWLKRTPYFEHQKRLEARGVPLGQERETGPTAHAPSPKAVSRS